MYSIIKDNSGIGAIIPTKIFLIFIKKPAQTIGIITIENGIKRI